MSFTLLSVIILTITALIVYIEVRRGYKQGLSKSLINVALILFSAIIGAVLSSLAAGGLTELIMFIIEMAKMEETVIKFVGGYLPVILVAVKMILSLVLYLPVFFVFKISLGLLLKLVYGMIVKKTGYKLPHYLSEDEDVYVKKEKVIGAVLGSLSGMMISIILFMPLMGTLKSVSKVTLIAKDILGKETISSISELALVDKYSNDAVGTVYDACGGGALYDLATRISYSGQVSCLNKELDAFQNINIPGLVQNLSAPEGSVNDKLLALEPMLDSIHDSVVLRMFTVEIIKSASSAWLEYDDYLGLPRPDLGAQKAMDQFLNSILLVCSTTDFDHYDQDIRTLLNVAKIVGENSDAFNAGDYDSFIEAFIETKSLDRIEEELEKNPRTLTTGFALNDMIMSTIVSELNVVDKYSSTVKDQLYRSLADSLTDTMSLSGSSKTVTLTNQLIANFKDCGIEVPDEIGTRLALALSEGVATKDNKITEKEVKEYFDSFN